MSDFNRDAHEPSPLATDEGRVPFPLRLGDETRRLLSAALVAVARDLLVDVPPVQDRANLPGVSTLSPDSLKDLREQTLDTGRGPRRPTFGP